jgi:hypothetical protein
MLSEIKGRVRRMQLTKEEIIDKLKLERSILADGGYGRSVRTPWRPNQYFRDSITCPNVGESEKVHPCSECFLIEYVHPACKDLNIPCHFVPLNAGGDTIDSLLRQGNTARLEEGLLQWIESTIKRLEQPKGCRGSGHTSECLAMCAG